MTKETYWLNKLDAEFITSVAKKYSSGSKAEAESHTDPDMDEAVYEITITQHAQHGSLGDDEDLEHATLLSALLADARSLKDVELFPEDDPEFPL